MTLLREDLRRKRDIFAMDSGVQISALRVCLTDGTSANVLYRGMRWCADNRLLPFAYFFQYLNKVLNGCVIGVSAQFGPGFVLMHPVGVIINSKVRGGRNVTLESGVVLGDNKGASPVLGSDVFVGAGAKVFGAITLGNHVSVGANAVVCKDAPHGALMLGIPAKPHTSSGQGDA